MQQDLWANKLLLTGFFTGWNRRRCLHSHRNSYPASGSFFEYYTETSGELLHIQEEQLKSSEVFWEIEFYEDGVFNQQSNSLEEFMKSSGINRWSLSKNFVTLLSNDFRNSIEYQFAIDKGTLKLLKKDFSGKIEFFGFFRKLESEK